MTTYDFYRKNGFILIKKVLSADQVLELRKKIYSDLPENFQGSLGIDYFLNLPQISELQFNQKIIKALMEICNDSIYYINDINLQINNANNKGNTNGWHIDANSEVSRFEDYLFKKEYTFCKVGIYLQNNTNAYGGGVDVELKGHKSFRDFGEKKLNYLMYYLDRFFISHFRKRICLPIEAGDCLIFDSRLPHASSAHSMGKNEIPNEFKKITLYWDVADNINAARNFIENSMLRALKLDEKSAAFFANYLRYSFPTSYNNNYLDLVNKSKLINVYSLNENVGLFFDKYFKELFGEGQFIEID